MDAWSSDSSNGGGGGSSRDSVQPKKSKPQTKFNSHKLVWNEQQFIYVGQECSSMPDPISLRYGESCRRLDLTFNNFSSLKFLKHFVNLEELIVDNNNLDDNLRLPVMPKLRTFSLNKNKVKDLETFLDKVHSSLPNLDYLSLLGNPACPNQLSSLQRDEEDYYRYRLRVIFRIPTLNFLDSSAVKKIERLEAKRSGQFTRILRPNSVSEGTGNDESSDDSNEEARRRYTPLPSSAAADGIHKGAYGVCRYKYLGLHSEGNRFIRNNDL
ncbi:hypothetical protein CHUAL_013706 [Chamberlinius hualienensis]